MGRGLGLLEFRLVRQNGASQVAVSLAIAIRLVTLWLGVSIGGVALLRSANR